MNNQQTVSRVEYRRLDNRVTCILQQRWPAHEIRQWVGILKGKQQSVACAILRRRHLRLGSLVLQAIAAEVLTSNQARLPHLQSTGALWRWPLRHQTLPP